METTLKKFIIIPILILLLVITALPLSAHAQDITEEASDIGVSNICPDEQVGYIQLYGTNRPANIWNISTKGKCNFKGNASKMTLYTNYKFKGKNQYTFHVKNTGDSSIVVKAKKLTKTYANAKIKAGDSATVSFSGIKKSTEFYLTFEGSSFSGYIK